MHQPYVLIHQARPSHQILLHQALNGQGVFNVRISESIADLDACLCAERRPDLLILDHAMPARAGLALFAQPQRARIAVRRAACPNASKPCPRGQKARHVGARRVALAAVYATPAACLADTAGTPWSAYSNCHASPACSLKRARFDELSAAPAGQSL